MASLVRRGTGKTKRLIKEALRSMGPSPDLLAELALLRNQVQADASRLGELVTQVNGLAAEVESFRVVRDALSVERLPVSDLTATVVGVGERVHVHEQELQELRRRIERIGGSVLDGLAVNRRLQSIESRIGGTADVDAGQDERPGDRGAP